MVFTLSTLSYRNNIVYLGKDKNGDYYYKKLITFVKDRSGHDRRYAINRDKIKKKLEWKQQCNLEKSLDVTIKRNIDNQGWVDRIRNGEYKRWINKNYELRKHC